MCSSDLWSQWYHTKKSHNSCAQLILNVEKLGIDVVAPNGKVLERATCTKLENKLPGSGTPTTPVADMTPAEKSRHTLKNFIKTLENKDLDQADFLAIQQEAMLALGAVTLTRKSQEEVEEEA